MVKITKFFIFFLLLQGSLSLAQAQTIEGRVTDQLGGPLPDAYVMHLASQHHAHTNELGYFLLNNIQKGDTLMVTHVGFDVQKVVVQDLNTTLEIKLAEKVFQIDEIVVAQSIRSQNRIAQVDLQTNPVQSSQEVLRKVPGLFIGQHAGGGKAEQIFLRGFDIDHGTDINITVDGMPVNMVSHAHGQGYADLHFVIPETINQIDFGKGPYYANKGNFTTAGYVNFETFDRLESSQVKIDVGRFNTYRAVGLFNVVNSANHNAYVAAEYRLTDGPFTSSQNFNRFNIMAKYTGQISNRDEVSVLASYFTSKWDASGQIPQRAVDSELIGRFGAIDDTEGGQTSRTNLSVEFNRNLGNNSYVKNQVFYSHYDFELYSNFTFFLNDPVNGDQIRQRESRDIIGVQSELNKFFYFGNVETLFQLGAGLRYDNVNGNELSRTRNRRTTLSRVQLGDVDESNLFAYANAEFELGDWIINPALRVDFFKFDYVDNLDSLFDTQSASEAIVSPKLNIIYNYSPDLQFFLKTGIGFHSNDTRVIIEQADGEDILPAAYGADVGAIWKPMPRLIVNAALWYLHLEQEFVYVGDEGIVEPSGETQRTGVDFGIRYQMLDWLFLDADVNYTYARSIDAPEDEDRIPLAPDLTATGGLSVRAGNFNAGLRGRYLADRPANEDNSIVAEGYFITDLNANYRWGRTTFGIAIENLFDVDWNETQFATESRLSFEDESVEEIHFTPGTPFFIQGTLKYEF